MNQVNFLPEDYLERRRQQRTNILCLSLFALVMAGLIAAFVTKERSQAAQASETRQLNDRMDAVARQLAQIEEMQARKEKMIKKADVTASLLERRPRHFLLALLTNSLPKGASLMSIELATQDVKPKQPVKQEDPGKSGRASRVGQPQADPKAGGKPDAAGAGGAPARIETIRVIGLAPDDKVVSKYIATLNATHLFREVALQFTEEYSYQDQPLRRFMIQADLDDQAQVNDKMIQSQKVRPGAFE